MVKAYFQDPDLDTKLRALEESATVLAETFTTGNQAAKTGAINTLARAGSEMADRVVALATRQVSEQIACEIQAALATARTTPHQPIKLPVVPTTGPLFRKETGAEPNRVSPGLVQQEIQWLIAVLKGQQDINIDELVKIGRSKRVLLLTEAQRPWHRKNTADGQLEKLISALKAAANQSQEKL